MRRPIVVLIAIAAHCGAPRPEPRAVDVGPAASSSSPAMASSAAPAAPSSAAREPPDPPIAITRRDPVAFDGRPEIAGDALCARLEAELLRPIAQAPTCADGGGGGFDAKSLVQSSCVAFRGGAWAIGVRDVAADPRCRTMAVGGDMARARWFAVYASGTTRMSGPSRAITGDGFRRTWLRPAVFDYDGDGRPEFLVMSETETHLGDGVAEGEVLTMQGGAVRAYEPAKGLRAVGAEDIDEDGRPDLLYEGPFSALYLPYGTTSNKHTSRWGPVFVAHSLRDGTFSRDDAIARAYAERGCPRMPASIVVRRKDDAHVDDEQSLFRVRCARLRGMPSAELRARIAAECEAPGKDDSCVGKGERVCLLRDTMLAWADAEPPLRL